LQREVTTEPAEVEEPLLQSRWGPLPASQTLTNPPSILDENATLTEAIFPWVLFHESS
jgi:hypothetical protein